MADKAYLTLRRALAITSFVVLVTGVLSFFIYQPTAAQAWNEIYDLQSNVSLSSFVSRLHRFASYFWIPVALLTVLVGFGRRANWASGVLACGLGAAVAALLTSALLPWDQLAIEAVAVGSDERGLLAPLDSDIRFILSNGAEVSQSTYMWFVIGHLVLGVTALAAGLIIGLRRVGKATAA